MKIKFCIILTILMLSYGIYTYAFNPLDYVVDVYTDEEGTAWTIYDMSLIPSSEFLPEVPQNNNLANFRLNRSVASNITLFNTITGGLDVSVNFLYSNIYNEKILNLGQSLTIESKIKNTSGTGKTLLLYVATYDNNDILQSITVQQTLNVTTSTALQTFSTDYTLLTSIPSTSHVKTFIWDSVTLQPFADSVKLKNIQEDYYSDEVTRANLIDYNKVINGKINLASDVDYIKFIPSVSSDFVVNSTSTQTINLALYDSNNLLLGQNNNGRIAYNLIKDNTYYLRISGNTICDYSLNIAPINSVYLDVEKYATISTGNDCHIYKFTPSEISTYIFTSVGNTEVKGTLYDSNFNELQTNSTSDGTVSFRISKNLTAGNYYIAISPKAPNVSGRYSLYVEKPLTVIVN